MKKKRLGFLVVMLLTILNVSAQETFKVMFYNLLNYPLEDAVPNREDDLDFIKSSTDLSMFEGSRKGEVGCKIITISGE